MKKLLILAALAATLTGCMSITVKDYGYEVVRDNGNPAALKLTYNARYGTFKGTFKVFCVTEAGRAKRRTATVNGVVVDGVGYGSAVIKKVGAIPVSIE